MWDDPVVLGTLTCSLIALAGALVYAYSIGRKLNGSWEDGYICILLLAFASWAVYLGYARAMMYFDKEKWMYLLSRTEYIPPIYFMIVALVGLLAHKLSSIRRRIREQKRKRFL